VSRCGQRGQDSGADRRLPTPWLPLPVGDRPLEQGDLVAQLRRCGLSSAGQDREHLLPGLGQPALAVAPQPCLLDVADEPAPLGVGDPLAGPRLGESQALAREDEQRATHRQVLDQRPVEVQGPLQIAHGHAGDAHPCGQVDRRGVGPVQADHAPGRLDDVPRPMTRCQAVTTGQPSSALGDRDLSHTRILPRLTSGA
jgi:hypothetical protein